MWLFVIMGLAFLGLGFAGARGVFPPEVALLSLGGFFFSLVGVILFGYQSRKTALADRSRDAATSMLVMMAAMLKEENDETLERIAAKGGPAGDAASMILQRRRGN